jgi:hypothetical protein
MTSIYSYNNLNNNNTLFTKSNTAYRHIYIQSIRFVETKTDGLVVINFADFKFILNNRKNIAYRRSGGIMVGYSEHD